jgi:hypothetical protein
VVGVDPVEVIEGDLSVQDLALVRRYILLNRRAIQRGRGRSRLLAPGRMTRDEAGEPRARSNPTFHQPQFGRRPHLNWS